MAQATLALVWNRGLDLTQEELHCPEPPLAQIGVSSRLESGFRTPQVEAGPEQARTWRGDDWKGSLPDLVFPADRSWLFSTLWDDDWTCIGGSRVLVDAFLADAELRDRVREVDPSMEDATPPGHVAY